MAFLTVDFRSAVLEKACAMNVIIPEEVTAPHRVIYLLHGLSDDHSVWCRNTSIERYAAAAGFMVVMPDGGRSFYADMEHGGRYWSFVAEELPRLTASLFHVSDLPSDTFAAGLSMGGYGALKLGLTWPERFAAIAALSPVTSIVNKFHGFNWDREITDIFGTPKRAVASGCELSELAAAAAAASGKRLPPLFIRCGDADFLYRENLAFRERLSAVNYPGVDFAVEPGAGHSWDFWDRRIAEALTFFNRVAPRG